VVGIVGDLKFEEALPTIEKYFGRLPRGERPEQPSVVEPEQAGERRFSVQHDAEPLVFAGYRKPVYPDPKEPAISLFLEYAMGSRVAPLYKEIVLEKKLASSFGYFEAPSDTFPNLVIFYAEPIAPQTNESVLAAFDKSLKELLAKPVPAKQMEIIKRRMMKGALMSMKSNMGLASELAEVEQKFGSWKVTIDWYRQMLELTPEQVRAAAMEILSSERRTVGLLSRGTNGAE
ncbi:MAG: insulinase family protein, partial [Bdellovibrionales bacterium]|nr:insulinase family protein [Bdellovibrionales bacterium]